MCLDRVRGLISRTIQFHSVGLVQLDRAVRSVCGAWQQKAGDKKKELLAKLMALKLRLVQMCRDLSSEQHESTGSSSVAEVLI